MLITLIVVEVIVRIFVHYVYSYTLPSSSRKIYIRLTLKVANDTILISRNIHHHLVLYHINALRRSPQKETASTGTKSISLIKAERIVDLCRFFLNYIKRLVIALRDLIQEPKVPHQLNVTPKSRMSRVRKSLSRGYRNILYIVRK